MAAASDILALAASYIGVKESPPYSNNVIFNTHYYGKPVNSKSLHCSIASQRSTVWHDDNHRR